ncbi:MAG: hypothetical protein ACRDRW_08235 [Pseudonocardiaceae bacterium]
MTWQVLGDPARMAIHRRSARVLVSGSRSRTIPACWSEMNWKALSVFGPKYHGLAEAL